MNISYNWLKDYLTFDMHPDEVAEALTSIGLETGSVEEVETIKGGLEGLVVGEVLTCMDHPDSDHLHLTVVNIGDDAPLPIVCGAPNVAAGQKVIVATIGTVLYFGDKEIKIKKGKIRGAESHGMICAEDEIGISDNHAGIIVLPADTPVGMLAKTYYNVSNDYVLEVDITPNRVDATSHIGVARDLAAWMKQNRNYPPFTFTIPSVEAYYTDDPVTPITIEVANTAACIRYSGVTIRNVTVKESPDWLKERLTTIGLRPINNVVDITNYVMHELGQPLHAFDAAKIKGDKVVVRTMPEETRFVTLDGVERTLTDNDLMICNTTEPMCIGGVFGGLDSGVTDHTKEVFLESACFHPSWIRRTARRFGLNTDSSFRFERGLDPNKTVYVLKRAAMLIKEIAEGVITGDIQDVYPTVMEPFIVDIAYKKINSLIGKEIPIDTIKDILSSLEITIASENAEGLSVRVPVYRFDVRRDVDVIEDILRIYGYNNVPCSDYVQASLSYQTPTDKSYKMENIISEQLCGAGFNEIVNNSLTRSAYYDELETYPETSSIKLENPLSADLNVMRQTLLFGGLQNAEFNIKHKHKNIRFFEFGNCYTRIGDNEKAGDSLSAIEEDYHLGLWMSGKRIENSWAHNDETTSIFELKAHIENIIRRLGIPLNTLCWHSISNDIYSSGIRLTSRTQILLGYFGIVRQDLLKKMDVEHELFFAELSWNSLMKMAPKERSPFHEISKFPEVRRDLALLVNKSVTFAEIQEHAYACERKLLKDVVLFDIYEGRNLPADKKSYAVSFYLQDNEKTLNDKQIEAIMSTIQKKLETHLDVQLR